MKKYFILLFIAVIFFVGILQTACTKDEGDDGDIPADVREQFIGEWRSQETYSSGGEPVISTMVITKNQNNSSQIFISNLNSLGLDQLTYAIVTSRNFTIPEQIVCGQTIKGSGKLNNETTILMNYISHDNADADTVSAVLTKKS